MINQKVYDALDACKDILVYELQKELEKTPGHKTDVCAYFLNQYDGTPCMEKITSVELKNDIVVVNYIDGYDDEMSGTADMFTIDEIAEIISQL